MSKDGEIDSKLEKESSNEGAGSDASSRASREAQDNFASGQGQQFADKRQEETKAEVNSGLLPSLDIANTADRSSAVAKDADGRRPDQSRQQEKSEAPPKPGPAKDAQDPYVDKPDLLEAPKAPGSQPDEKHSIIDWNASEGFKKEVEDTRTKVLSEMPEHLREYLTEVPTVAVGSIADAESGEPANGELGPDGLLLAEKRYGEGSLETILKHEYGHAFDQAADPPFSEDPNFRKLVDEAVQRNPFLNQLKRMLGEEFYAEIFADLFANNLSAPGRELSMPHMNRIMPKARDWIRQRMMEKPSH